MLAQKRGGKYNFFHTTNIARQRYNRVLRLKDASGNWTMDIENLKTIACEYYVHLYSSYTNIAANLSSYSFSYLTHGDLRTLDRLVSEAEVKPAFSKIAPLKRHLDLMECSQYFFKGIGV